VSATREPKRRPQPGIFDAATGSKATIRYNNKVLHSLKTFNNKVLIFTVLAIFAIGLLALSSAASGAFFAKQLLYGLISAIIVFVLYRIFDLNFFQKNATIIYFLNIALLLVLKALGATVLGSQRWLKLGPVSIQPSEIAKVCLIIYLAAWLSKNPIQGYKDILKTLAIVALPASLVLIQPDLGTTLVYVAICFGMLFWAGAKLIELLLLVSPLLTAIFSSFGTELITYNHGNLHFALTLPFLIFITVLLAVTAIYYKAWRSPWLSTNIFGLVSFNLLIMVFKTIAWSFLKEYQQERVLTFINPDRNPLGAGYNITQSKIAAGSGGLFGKGFLSGSQGQLNFLPERKTDFIFVIISEELGFIGSFCVICIYCFIFYKIYRIANNCRCYFSKLLATGLNSFLFLHFFINIAMAIGLIPVVGAPLPMISYGGTMLVITMLSFAIIFNLDINKNKSLSRFDPNF